MVWEWKNAHYFVLNISPHGLLEPRMHAKVSEFWEPNFAKCMCGLAFLNQQIISSWHPKATEPQCSCFLIVFLCSELGPMAGSLAFPFLTCT